MRSGMAMVGCVSLSCSAFLTPKSFHSQHGMRLKRRMTSRSVAEAKKYCCLRRSSLPLGEASDG